MAFISGQEKNTVYAEMDPALSLAVLHVCGYLDEVTVCNFREVAYDAIDRGYRDLIIEISQALGISSVGVGALISIRRRFGCDRGRVALAGCKPPLAGILTKVGVPDLLEIFDDVDAARSAMFQVVTEEFQPKRENGARMREWLRSVTVEAQMTPEEAERLEAASSEAFMNAVQHAAAVKGDTIKNCIKVRVVLGSVVNVEIQDQGPGFEARQYFTVDPSLLHTGARGLGIYLMRNLMDGVQFIPGPPGAGLAAALAQRCGSQNAW